MITVYEKEDIKKFLVEFKGYRKEGKRRLKEILKKRGFEASLRDCADAIREVNQGNLEGEFKRLFFDIETSPNIGFFWRPGHKIRIGAENIIKERAVICVSWKWEGEDKVYNLSWDKNQDDKELLEQFSKEMYKASEVVTQNGDAFDIKWLRGRCLYHRIPFPTYVKSLDTYVKSKAQFNLNSHSLNYMANFLGVGGKMETGGFDLWKNIVLNNDPEAMSTMIRYCDNDVIILEDVFQEMKNYIKLNTHEGVTLGKSKRTCPSCGSDNVEHRGNWVTTSGTIQRLMQCECGADYKISNRAFLNET